MNFLPYWHTQIHRTCRRQTCCSLPSFRCRYRACLLRSHVALTLWRFEATIQPDINTNQTSLPSRCIAQSSSIQAGSLLSSGELFSTIYLPCVLTRISWVLYLISFCRMSKGRSACAHDEEAAIPQHHTSQEPRLPEVTVLRHAPSQNDELETWLGIRKSTSTSGRSAKKMSEMSIAKLTSGVADGGWLSR